MSASSENVTGGGALEPLRNPVFRMLWLAWLAANISLWMHDVAAAWLMTTLTQDPALVALVATAGTLPMFLLASLIGRAGRFFIVAGLLYKFGPTMKTFIEKYFNLLSIVFTVLLIGAFALLKMVA